MFGEIPYSELRQKEDLKRYSELHDDAPAESQVSGLSVTAAASLPVPVDANSQLPAEALNPDSATRSNNWLSRMASFASNRIATSVGGLSPWATANFTLPMRARGDMSTYTLTKVDSKKQEPEGAEVRTLNGQDERDPKTEDSSYPTSAEVNSNHPDLGNHNLSTRPHSADDDGGTPLPEASNVTMVLSAELSPIVAADCKPHTPFPSANSVSKDDVAQSGPRGVVASPNVPIANPNKPDNNFEGLEHPGPVNHSADMSPSRNSVPSTSPLVVNAASPLTVSQIPASAHSDKDTETCSVDSSPAVSMQGNPSVASALPLQHNVGSTKHHHPRRRPPLNPFFNKVSGFTLCLSGSLRAAHLY